MNPERKINEFLWKQEKRLNANLNRILLHGRHKGGTWHFPEVSGKTIMRTLPPKGEIKFNDA